MDQGLTFYDFCCGAGGLSQGFVDEGWTCLGGVDMDPDSCVTYERNIRATAHNMRVGEFDGRCKVDAIIGGPPCQPHSVSGRRLGMRDPRASALHEIFDVVDDIRPKVVALENVKGLTSSKDADGTEGGALLHIRLRLMDLGYVVSHEVLDAHWYGDPQYRERIFIVAIKSGHMWRTPPVRPVKRRLDVYDVFCDILGDDVDLPNHEKTQHRQTTIDRIAALWREDRWSLYENFKQSWARLALDQPAPTQTENHGGICIHPIEPRVITPREMARLQSFPDDFEFHGSKSSVLKQIGNAVPVMLARAVARSIIPFAKD